MMAEGKRLGEASSAEEAALEAAVRRVGHWRNGSLRYWPVSGGITNSNWRVMAADGDFFVKIPGQGTEMFIDRGVALEASAKAHRLGVGPAVYDWLADSGVEIAAFMGGWRTCGLGDFSDDRLCAAVAAQYRRLHQAPALRLTKTVFEMIDEHVAQVAALGGWQPLDMAWLLARVAEARAAIEGAGMDWVVCFNDPMPGNFLASEDGSVLLIDYEFASNNDRAYDLGAWFGESFFGPEREAALTAAYAGREAPGLLARARVYKAVADVKWALWSMVQERISAVDFDYRKYGVWKFMRAREFMQGREWRWLLAEV